MFLSIRRCFGDVRGSRRPTPLGETLGFIHVVAAGVRRRDPSPRHAHDVSTDYRGTAASASGKGAGVRRDPSSPRRGFPAQATADGTATVSVECVGYLIVQGAFDALARILTSDVRYQSSLQRARRLAVVRGAHEALAPLLLAARECVLDETASLSARRAVADWLASRDFRLALVFATVPFTDESALCLAAKNVEEGRARAASAGLVLVDCLFAAFKAVPGEPDGDVAAAWGATAQRILEALPRCERGGDHSPLGAAFHVLFDLGLAGHVDSTAEEDASKSLVKFLESDRIVDDGSFCRRGELNSLWRLRGARCS